MITAICPGSFDPVTIGHLDIITRASKIFDRVVVAVLNNPKKSPVFTAEERVELIERVTAGLGNVDVISHSGLLADLAQEVGASVIVKGLRAVSDFEYEFQMALANRKLNPNVETVFLTTSAENMFLSSSVVKQIAEFGGDISGFVPQSLCEDISARLSGKGVAAQ